MQKTRIWEIDLVRTIAIILMIIFHTVYDLNQFADLDINYLSGFWYWEGKASALLFIFVAGISGGLGRDTVKRGIKVLALAMVISLATYIVFREQYVRFGILHFLGTAMILFPLLKKCNNIVLLISSAALAALSIPLENFYLDTIFLIPVGVVYREFSSVDYYPLIPYLSVFILGILLYKVYYYRKMSLFKFSFENRFIQFISSKSLFIYFIHQPVIIAIVYLLMFTKAIN